MIKTHKWIIRATATLVALLTVCGAARAADKGVALKLGTLAPNNSSFHKSLLSLREKWAQASNGSVKLTIFPDGRLGGEADMVGLMMTGSLDAGLLTAVGLSEIEPAVNALQSMPMAFRTLEEVDYVGEKLRPMLEPRLAAKGFLVLFWTDSGWVRFFSKTPVITPDDLRKQKVFAWAGNAHEFDIWKSSGCNPVALETAGIAPALLSGTITAISTPPLFANAMQLDTHAPNMLELNWAPLVGACVVRSKSWEKIPANQREALIKIAGEIGQQVKSAGRAENDAAVQAMTKRGLKVHKITPEIEAQWRATADNILPQIRGKIVPADMFDQAQKLLQEYRSKK